MSKLRLSILMLLVFLPTTLSALDDDIGFEFSEVFRGYICIDETNPYYCDKRFATEDLAIDMSFSAPSANRYFLDGDFFMNMTGEVHWNNERLPMDPGYFVIEDFVDEEDLMYFHYGFSYMGEDGVKYAIELKKKLFMNYPEETMWEDLTTMYVKRWQVFGKVRLPAGAGVIVMDRGFFSIGKWIGDLKSTNGSLWDDSDVRIMALDFFVFDKFNKIYDGHPL